jgi:ankyrin repeat protein
MNGMIDNLDYYLLTNNMYNIQKIIHKRTINGQKIIINDCAEKNISENTIKYLLKNNVTVHLGIHHIIQCVKNKILDIDNFDTSNDRYITKEIAFAKAILANNLLSIDTNNINELFVNNRSLLMSLNMNTQFDIIYFLIKQLSFPYINEKNKITKNTMLISACLSKENENIVKLIELLLSHKNILINAQNRDNDTALIMASFNGNSHICQLLINHKNIDVNIINNAGITALMVAVQYENYDICKLLLNHKNIDVNIKDNNGYTALMLANHYKNTEIIQLFNKTGGGSLYYQKYNKYVEKIMKIINDI